jgi:UDP-glucose 4-epimerase
MVDEFLALAYHREKGLPVTVFRLFNTVGPRQTGRYGMVIPRFVRQAVDGQPLTVYGDGEQTRCFLHVKDAVAGILSLAAKPSSVGKVYNIGSVEEVSIKELAQQVLAAVDQYRAPADPAKQGRIVYVPYDEAYAEGFEDMLRRVPDVSNILSATSWQPRISLDEILSDVIASIHPVDSA